MFTPTHMFTLSPFSSLQSFLVFKPSHMPFFYFPSPTPDSSCLSHMMSVYALYCQLSYSFHSSIHLLIICPKRQHAGGGGLHGNNRREVGWHFLLIDIWRRSTQYGHTLFLCLLFQEKKRKSIETLHTICQPATPCTNWGWDIQHILSPSTYHCFHWKLYCWSQGHCFGLGHMFKTTYLT